jgi:xanthine dehydrogenase molybdenum-binding subunit
VAVGLGEAQLLLNCPNWDLRSSLVLTNRNPAGVVRGFGGQELEAALQPVLTEALIRADLDPVEFFKVNFVRPGRDYFWREGGRWTYRGLDFRPAMARGAEAFGWRGKFKGWLRPSAVEGPRRHGVGVWVHGNADIGEDESEAYVRLNPDGSAVVHVLVSEFGTGTRSSLAKMAAEVLDLPLDKVRLTPPDTLVNPFEFGLVGSRGTYAVGSAVIRAAEDARRRLLEQAGRILEIPAEELDTADGLVFPKDGRRKGLSWKGVMGIFRTITGTGFYEADFSLTNFLMLFVEVAVDVETGRVDLVSLLPATDVGQIINPQMLTEQLQGCLGSAGVDTAIFEEPVLDPRRGWMLNPNLVDYKWRTFVELPRFQQVVLESGADSHRFRALGVGEIATAPGPPAVMMAVSNALGVRLSDYPLTPDKILAAWRQAGEGARS